MKLYWRAGMKPKQIAKGITMVGKNVLVVNEVELCRILTEHLNGHYIGRTPPVVSVKYQKECCGVHGAFILTLDPKVAATSQPEKAKKP